MPGLYDTEAPRPFCGGLWKASQLAGLLIGLALFVAFSAGGLIQEYSLANRMLGLTAMIAAFWVFEVIPIYATSLMPMVLLPLLRVTSAANAASAYWSWIQMLFLGVFLVDIALEQVGLPKRIALTLLLRVGVTRPAVVLALFMALAWALSMFTSNIAATLMLCPFATSLLNAAEERAMDARDAADADTESAAASESKAGDNKSVKNLRRFSRGVMLGISFGAGTGGIATIIGTPANGVLLEQPLLAGSRLGFSHWIAFGLPISAVTALLAFGVLFASYAHRGNIPLSQEVLVEAHDRLLAEAGPLSRDEVAVGLVSLAQIVLLIINPLAISPFVTNAAGVPLENSAGIACLCGLSLFFLPSQSRRGQALLTWRTVHEKLDFGVLLLIGCGFAIARGFIDTGLDVVLGRAIGSLLPHMSWISTTFAVVFLVSLLAQLFNNIATASIVLPILASAAESAVVNPMLLMLPATVACSLSFVLPTASPCNVVVLGRSNDLSRPLRIRDFARVGLPILLLTATAAAVLSFALSVGIFDALEPFPQWACESGAVACSWVPEPGLVQGRQVSAQACIELDEYDGRVCRLWNGTLLELSAVMMEPVPF